MINCSISFYHIIAAVQVASPSKSVSAMYHGTALHGPYFNSIHIFVSFVLHPYSDSLLSNLIITSSSVNSWYLYSHLISFVWSQDQHLTPLFQSSSFVFISHLTNMLSYSVFMFVACLFLCHFAFEKEPARFETLTFILQNAKFI